MTYALGELLVALYVLIGLLIVGMAICTAGVVALLIMDSRRARRNARDVQEMAADRAEHGGAVAPEPTRLPVRLYAVDEMGDAVEADVFPIRRNGRGSAA